MDTGPSKSFMSKSHYLCCKSLHSLPKFASKTQIIQVGKGQLIRVLFIIPIIVDIHRHRFKIYTLVSETHENVDLVLEIKNIFELESVINSWNSCFNFLNRVILIFPKGHMVSKTKQQRIVKVEAQFTDEISGFATIKVMDKKTWSTMMFKLKFIWNSAALHITNRGLDTILIWSKRSVRNIRFKILMLF